MARATGSGFTDEQLELLKRQPRVHTRPGGGNTTLEYIDHYDVYAAANGVLGADGWHTETMDITERAFGGSPEKPAAVFYYARVRVTLTAVGLITEGTGTGEAILLDRNGQYLPLARAMGELDKAVKTAETDATRRALHRLGPLFGLELYFKPGGKQATSRRQPPQPQGRAQPQGDMAGYTGGGYEERDRRETTPAPYGSGGYPAEGNVTHTQGARALCGDCGKEVGYRNDGTPWEVCFDCNQARKAGQAQEQTHDPGYGHDPRYNDPETNPAW